MLSKKSHHNTQTTAPQANISMSPKVGTQMRCGNCRGLGHNRRTCSYDSLAEVLLKESLPQIPVDEEPMAEDFILTDEEDEEECPNWGDLPLETVSVILDFVEQNNREYHTDKVKMVNAMGGGTVGDEICEHSKAEKHVILRSRMIGGGAISLGNNSRVLSALLVDADNKVGEKWRECGKELMMVGGIIGFGVESGWGICG